MSLAAFSQMCRLVQRERGEAEPWGWCAGRSALYGRSVRTHEGLPLSTSPDTGILYCDDNLSRLAHMPSETIDLVYLDPPFFSNRVYEVIWGDEAEVRSLEDRWEGGIKHYVDWMHERVLELHRILKRDGSLYLHCDPHASHYLKVMLDDVSGRASSAARSCGSARGRITRRKDGVPFTTRFSSTRKAINTHGTGLYRPTILCIWKKSSHGRISADRIKTLR